MRGRDDRRAAPARTDWDDRDRNNRNRGSRNSRRSRSRSPIKSKLMALAMSTGRDNKTVKRSGDRSRRESSRDRSQKARLRMDELDGKRNITKARSPEHHRSDAHAGQKKKPISSSLDKVVKKAREERTNYWDKKILEAEEKDPDRWGHSGFKELYHKKDAKKVVRRKRQRSRSGSQQRGMRSRSRSVSPNFKRRQSHGRSVSRSFSRSRSPIKRVAKSRKDLKSFSRSPSPVSPTKSKIGMNKNKGKGLAATKKTGTKHNPRDLGIGLASKTQKSAASVAKGNTGGNSNSKNNGITAKSRAVRRSSSFSSSGSSLSRSRSRSRSYQAPSKRISGRPIVKQAKGGKPVGGSDSYSSSSSSSDEDVLQLHAKDKVRNSSHSDSRSSSSSGISIRPGGILRRGSSSSTSDSLSSSDSDSDISIRAKPAQKIISKKDKVGAVTAVPKNVNVVPKINTSNTTPTPALIKASTNSTKPTVKKAAAATTTPVTSTTAVASKPNKSKPGTTTITTTTIIKPTNSNAPASKAKLVEKEKSASKKATKSPSESGETESESGSSDSDSEPRMTLSERFAKLSQMSTDKREMAKPVLSVNEIDTKMRVVKDFRNPETPKVYVAGDGGDAPLPQSANRIKPRSRSPPTFPEDSRREMLDDRHQHFERLQRDVPAEQPLDWSNARVRFNYYKNRGCFDERPITFEEYVKWEDWYHKYREWLEQEAYYAQQGGRPAPNPGNRGVGGFPLGRRMDQTPMGMSGPPLSSRAHFGRAEGTTYLQAHERVGRRIDRTAAGSLVVNIRPYNNNAGGFQTRRRNGRPQ